MAIPAEMLAEMMERRRAESIQARRDRRRDLTIAGFACLGWCALGIFFILWSMRLGEPYARASFYAGIAIGNCGIIFTLLAVLRRHR